MTDTNYDEWKAHADAFADELRAYQPVHPVAIDLDKAAGEIGHWGMSLHDWLVGQALEPLLANEALDDPEAVRRAFDVADRVMLERQRRFERKNDGQEF